ncbi:hypothetical protein [uncultured Rothia sp.]|uniref:hypothetical protein n=1 Tax=uncultured Rothia sp. TaxID=316088 RepID=UPI00288B22FC|nr:hypothetical protein [uncultured Rothia sp.]
MGNLGMTAAVTSLVLVVANVVLIFRVILESTGYLWYAAARREIIANLLKEFGIYRESRVESLKRFGKVVIKNTAFNISHPFHLFPPKDVDNEFKDKVQNFLKCTEKTPSSIAQSHCIDSLAQLEKMTGITPKYDPFGEVYLSLRDFCSEIEEIKYADFVSYDDVLSLIKEESILTKYSWVKKRWQSGYLLPQMRDFIDYAGRGTTIGLFIGFTIALILGDPFGLLITVISVVGAIIGAISCLVRIDLAKNEVNRLNNKKYRSHVRVIVKSIISILCIYLFMNAYFLIVALLHGARIGG